jgi:hypothetical protein
VKAVSLSIPDSKRQTSNHKSQVQGTPDPTLADIVWQGYRRRLEAPEPAEPVMYSLWVDWFEHRRTAGTAFAAVLGDDVAELARRGRLHDLAEEPVARRARRVFEVSGPVPWQVKHDVYLAAATVPPLRAALFLGLLGSYHDVYGSLEPAAALDLLLRLDLPPETEYLTPLRTVLTDGRANHYHHPGAWHAAAGGVRIKAQRGHEDLTHGSDGAPRA